MKNPMTRVREAFKRGNKQREALAKAIQDDENAGEEHILNALRQHGLLDANMTMLQVQMQIMQRHQDITTIAVDTQSQVLVEILSALLEIKNELHNLKTRKFNDHNI